MTLSKGREGRGRTATDTAAIAAVTLATAFLRYFKRSQCSLDSLPLSAPLPATTNRTAFRIPRNHHTLPLGHSLQRHRPLYHLPSPSFTFHHFKDHRSRESGLVFSCGHATLELAVSAGPSVRRSFGLSVPRSRNILKILTF